MRHGALFNGIGGFQLAAHWCGWDNIFSVEIDKWCNKVTKQHFPECKQYEDIYDFNGKNYKGRIDIISGGFPCQPFSIAGKRKGNEDERALWPEMLRVIREIAPTWVVAENVSGLLTIEGGLAFKQVLSDLEDEDYEVQTYIIPACATNLPHRRSRVWIVAHAMRERLYQAEIHRKGDTESNIRQQYAFSELLLTKAIQQAPDGRDYRDRNGLSAKLDERRLKALGNAIVPQVAYEIFHGIAQTENTW